jgi:transcriptional regulator with GAF, ATPase, and Fis domain
LGWEARKIPAAGEVFSLDFYLYRTYQDKQEMQRRERENILKALGQSKGKIYGPDGAASILGIKPTTLASRMKKFKVADAKRTGA